MDGQGRTVVVCDNGSQVLRYGLAEDYSPVHEFPTVVGRLNNKTKLGETIDGIAVEEFSFGDDALKLTSLMDISNPIKNGIVEDWNDMTKLWNHVFNFEELKIEPKNSKICLTESSLNPAAKREKMIEIMFEKFGFHSVFIGNQSAMSLFSRGVTSGIVVDFYDDFTDVCPVHNHAMSKLAKRYPSSDNEKLAEHVFNAIQAADSKVHDELFKRIMLLNNSTIDASALESDIKSLYLERVLQGDTELLRKFKTRVDTFPAENDKAFHGGLLVATVNIDIDDFWVSQDDYKELGSRAFSK